MNVIQHRPVGEESVKEEIREPQESVDPHLHIRLDLHVRQFRAEPAQLDLEGLHLPLGLVQMVVLGKVRQKSAPQQVPSAPALGAVQTGADPIRGGPGGLSRLQGLPQLPQLPGEASHPGLQFPQTLSHGATGILELPGLFLQCRPVPLLTARKGCQLRLGRFQVRLHRRQLPADHIMPHRGLSGLRPLLVQSVLQTTGEPEEIRLQAPALQLVHVRLLLAPGGGQFLLPGLQGGQLTFQASLPAAELGLPGHLLPQGMQVLLLHCGASSPYFSSSKDREKLSRKVSMKYRTSGRS